MRHSIALRTAHALASLVFAAVAAAQAPAGTILDETIPPGANFDKANFRLWYPTDGGTLKGVVVLMPGSNGDGRPQAQDTLWQQFAAKHHLALLAGQITDKPHEQSFIEDYINVSKGSGQAMLDALASFASKSNHPELTTAPFLMWGMSAGGQFNYEFVAWKPERVVAFVVNKGGIYYSALLPKASREVPGILFVGGKDLAFRTNTIAGLFAVNRRAGALWAYADEPSAGHIVGRSREVATIFFEDMLAARVGAGATLQPLAEKSGFIGDLTAKTFQPMGDSRPPAVPTAWLPTERVARAWQALVTEKPAGQ
jgi:poly(3-hydroxybutyrate) depolymerase